MSISRLALPALVCLVSGTALYVSRGVLDRVVMDGRSVRLAELPGWPAWLGFVVMAGLALWCVDRALKRKAARGSNAFAEAGASLALPALALIALILPYLPWAADRLPALQMFAGPGRLLVWLLILTQLLWVGWQHGLARLNVFARIPRSAMPLVIAAATVSISGAAAARLTGTILFPAGDEPHYLVIAQSLWRDGDLAIENNHQRGDYREYFATELEPHYLTRGSDGEIYSIHPIGLPVLLAPVYALGGYRLTVAVLIAMAAAAAAIVWRWTTRALDDAAAATFGWAAVATSTAFLFNSFTVYPEIAAALAVAIAFTSATDLACRPAPWRPLAVGLACGALPWLSTKYAPMSAALVAIALARVWILRPASIDGRERARVPASAAIVLPYLLSLAGWFTFFYAYWGTPWPQAPYGAMVQTSPKNTVFGVPGLLFDQEYGLLAYSPVYILAASGLLLMWRRGGEPRRRAIEVAVTFAALLGTVGAFRLWWGGSAGPGRPIASGLLLLGIPMAVAFQAAARGSAQRAAQHLLLCLSAGIAATMVLAREGFLVNNGRDGTSTLLEYLSPLWHAWSLAPSFVYHEAGTALVHTAAWLAMAAAAATLLARRRTQTAGAASLTALTVLGTSLVTMSLVMPLLPNDPEWPALDLRARSRLIGLDRFDRLARPIAVVYDGMRVVPAESILPLLTLSVEPGQREEPQPLRVLLNGRFSLPAGHYRVDIDWNAPGSLEAQGDQALDLQIGRSGPPLERWRVPARPGERVQETFTLPVDASFVGFRGTPEVEDSIAAIRITPLDVVDESARVATAPVLAARRYPGATVLFHDDQTYPEPGGFWTIPGRTTSVTLALETADGRTALRMHPGSAENHVALEAYGWREDEDLSPGALTTVPLPDPARRIVPLTIWTETGFVPSSVDPASNDHRRLGAWVEIPATVP